MACWKLALTGGLQETLSVQLYLGCCWTAKTLNCIVCCTAPAAASYCVQRCPAAAADDSDSHEIQLYAVLTSAPAAAAAAAVSCCVWLCCCCRLIDMREFTSQAHKLGLEMDMEVGRASPLVILIMV